MKYIFLSLLEPCRTLSGCVGGNVLVCDCVTSSVVGRGVEAILRTAHSLLGTSHWSLGGCDQISIRPPHTQYSQLVKSVPFYTFSDKQMKTRHLVSRVESIPVFVLRRQEVGWRKYFPKVTHINITAKSLQHKHF